MKYPLGLDRISTGLVAEIALAMYGGEPCRICGSNLTKTDICDGAVFAGYSPNDEARSAHRECWDNRESMVWAYPDRLATYSPER